MKHEVVFKLISTMLAISVIIKCYIQTFLAFRNNFKNYGGGFSFKALWYIREEVANDDEDTKSLCNKMQTIHIIVFMFIIILVLAT